MVRNMGAQIPESEFDDRLEAVRHEISASGADAGVWFDSTSIEYLTGYHHLRTERPVALAVTDDEIEITVPKLELARAEAVSPIDAVHQYFDYPGGDPIEVITEMLRGLGVESVAADREWVSMNPERGVSSFSESVPVEPQAWVDWMRSRKSDVELDLIRESARWSDLALRYLASFAGESQAHPITSGLGAATEASRIMLNTLGDEYVARTRVNGPAYAGFISEHDTALPHGYSSNRRLDEGDILIAVGGANVDGYHSEIQRTMFIDDPDDEHVHYYELMTAAQEIAFDALAPGVPVSYVDQQVWEFFDEQGVADLVYHNVGHGIGLSHDEWPYVDRSSDVEITPGHVYVIEPGLYTDDYGYRHSDTIAVTDDGIERLSAYPRDLESNIIRIGETAVDHDHH